MGITVVVRGGTRGRRRGLCAALVLTWLVAWAWSAGSVAAQSSVQMLHRFAFGTAPQSPVGVTAVPEGGALVVAARTLTAPPMIARVLPDGTVRVLHVMPYDSSEPLSPLVRGGDGGYYGTTPANSLVSDHGSIFRIDLDGHFTTVYTFHGGADGTGPSALFPGPAGTIYGFTRSTTPLGLVHLVFVIGSDGTVTPGAFAMFARPASVGADGSAYGLSERDGCGGFRVLVRRDASGVEVPIAGPLGSGSCDNGFTDVLPLTSGGVVALAVRRDSVTAASSCDLWYIAPGTARVAMTMPEPCWTWTGVRRFRDDGAGGAVGFTERSVFRVSATGAATVLTRLPETGGILTSPVSDLDRHADGTLWAVGATGSTFNGGGVMAVPVGGSPTLVAAFAGGNHEGRDPTGPVVADADGFLYGATAEGGDYGRGVLYRVSRTGDRFNVLYTFTGRGDGGAPTGLVQTADGALYGTTAAGEGHGGTVFRVGRSGALTTIFVFRRDEDGFNPGALVVGRDGLLYGRTQSGGLHDWGTAFRISRDGAMTVLYHFPARSDVLPAAYPSSSPFTLGYDDQFYATTEGRTSINCSRGSVFRMSPSGQVTLLWTTEPCRPVRPELFQTADGRLWGSFYMPGAFVITPSATPTLMPIPLDGSDFGLKALTSDGNFVGVAARLVGSSYVTSLFQMTPQGRVWEFATFPRSPASESFTLLEGRDGFLYGTAPPDYPVTDLGAVFRVAAPGPSAPAGIRIVR